MLNRIEPLIMQENYDIPQAQAKLKNFPSLHKYFGDLLTKGLYMLQFRTCEDETCCIRKKQILSPPVPTSVLSADGEHYLPFEDTYGKSMTDRDCLSLQQKHNKPKPNIKQNYKFLGSRVVAVLECIQYKKIRCISLVCSLNLSHEISNFWRTSFLLVGCFQIPNLYVQPQILIATVSLKMLIIDQILETSFRSLWGCRYQICKVQIKVKAIKNVIPVCQHSFNKRKKEICCSLVEPCISSLNKGNISKSGERVTTNESRVLQHFISRNQDQ